MRTGTSFLGRKSLNICNTPHCWFARAVFCKERQVELAELDLPCVRGVLSSEMTSPFARTYRLSEELIVLLESNRVIALGASRGQAKVCEFRGAGATENHFDLSTDVFARTFL